MKPILVPLSLVVAMIFGATCSADDHERQHRAANSLRIHTRDLVSELKHFDHGSSYARKLLPDAEEAAGHAREIHSLVKRHEKHREIRRELDFLDKHIRQIDDMLQDFRQHRGTYDLTGLIPRIPGQSQGYVRVTLLVRAIHSTLHDLEDAMGDGHSHGRNYPSTVDRDRRDWNSASRPSVRSSLILPNHRTINFEVYRAAKP